MSGGLEGGTGHCLCGAVSYAFEGAPNWQAHCHCESCRRNCAAPFTSYFGVSHGKWRWTGTEPAAYASSPGVRRHFCTRCGTPMAFEGERWSHEIHFYAATLADPAAFRPTAHVNWNEHLPWVKLDDGLRTYYTPRRLGSDDDVAPALALIRDAFAGMAGRIDPPSSATRLSEQGLRDMLAAAELWVMEEFGAPVACVLLTPQDNALYIGKLAVAGSHRRRGLARQIVAHAEKRARALGLPALRLQTRVELTENHAAFRALGFERSGETAHPGFDRPTSFTFVRRLTG